MSRTTTRRALLLVAAASATVSACNALLGNDPPVYEPLSDAGVDRFASDVVPPEDAPIDVVPDVPPGEPASCDACAVVADNLDGPITALAVAVPGGARLHWIVSGQAKVWHYDVGTSAVDMQPTNVASPAHLAASDDGVWIAAATTAPIRWVPLAGSAVDITSSPEQVSAMAFVSPGLSALVWASSTRCVSCGNGANDAGACSSAAALPPATCGTPSTVVAASGFQDYSIFVGSDGIVRGQRFGSGKTLDTVLGAAGTAIGGPTGSAGSSDDEIYWSGFLAGADGGFLRRIFAGTGGASHAVSGTPSAITGDATHVYWASKTGSDTYGIWSASRNLDGDTKLASGQPGVSQVVVAADALYWTRRAPSGTKWQLVKLPK